MSFRLSQHPVHKSREQISTDSLQCLFSELLKLFTLLASTTLSGNEFQRSTTLCEKLYFLLFVLLCFLNILCLWPLVFVFSDWKYVGTVYFVDIIDDFYYTETLFTIMLDAINTYLCVFILCFYKSCATYIPLS